MALALSMMVSALLFSAHAAAVDFSDVPDNAWYKNAVDYVAENQLFSGNGDRTFSPKGSMTRAMFVTVLSKIANADVSRTSDAGFDDVPNTWYTDCVNWPEIRTEMASAFICMCVRCYEYFGRDEELMLERYWNPIS